jgi:hypothetical protein
MVPVSFDYTQVNLQEQVPMSDAEIKEVKKRMSWLAKATLKIIVMIEVILLIFLIWCIKPISKNDYSFLMLVFLPTVGICHLIFWLLTKFSNINLKKDIAIGKNVLTSVLIGKRKARRVGTFFIIAGRHQKEKISLPVDYQNYSHYQIGQKFTVHYLKYSKEILRIEI